VRLATSNDEVFNKLIDSEEDCIVYNLIRQIKSKDRAFIITDDSSYIYTQDSKRTPNWLFVKPDHSEKTFNEISDLVAKMVKLNPLLRINGRSSTLLPILDETVNRTGISYSAELPMSVYYCTEVIRPKIRGRMITPKEKHRSDLTKLISEMSLDNDGLFMDIEDSDKFVTSLVKTGSIYVWEDEKIVSIAKIAHEDEKYARINTVFTAIDERKSGYTEMLISELASKLLSKGLIPVIYADSKNVCKTAAYERIGFKKAGDITQFAFN
jgi:predicted GNAT family acetyltransferase